MVPGCKFHQNDKMSVKAWLWLSNLWQIWLIAQQLFQTNSKKIKILHHWPFVRGTHWWLGDSLHKGPAMRTVLSCHDVTTRGNFASCCRHVVSIRQTPGMGGIHPEPSNERRLGEKKESWNKPLCNRIVLPHKSGHFPNANGVTIRPLRSSHQP